ncbi:MAG: hypothetical protein U1E16_12330 [Hyphomicrobiales bacterium]|uniref:hypothetical protein n=1 Tax=Aestuariivirga sp. TaxID=2650926 RepID=UPI0035B45E78
MHRHPHLLNAATNLLGFALVIVGAVKFTNVGAKSYADECAWSAIFLFIVCISVSYWAIRGGIENGALNATADLTFFGGIASLTASLCFAAYLI